MPLYDFKCTACDHAFERIVRAEVVDVECPSCGHIADRQLSAPAAPQFKGTGFYQTDFKDKK